MYPQWTLCKISVCHVDAQSFVSKSCMTMPSTSNWQNSTQRFLRVSLLGYILHFSPNKISFSLLTSHWTLLTGIKVENKKENLFFKWLINSHRESKVYLNEELQKDMQRFKNAIDMLQVVLLALEKENIQLPKEVDIRLLLLWFFPFWMIWSILIFYLWIKWGHLNR